MGKIQKVQTAYAGYSAALDRIHIYSVSGTSNLARIAMCAIYSNPDKAAVWKQLKKDGWRIRRIGVVLVR